MTTCTPVQKPVRLPVEADASRIFAALQAAHDALEPTISAVDRLGEFDGTKFEPELGVIDERHLSGLVTVWADLADLLEELELFKRRLETGIRTAVVIRGEQVYQARRAA
jgi:hypothetical protein